MIQKRNFRWLLLLGTLISIYAIFESVAFAQSNGISKSTHSPEVGISITIAMALLLTGLTVLAIHLVARYIKSFDTDSCKGVDDRDH